MSETLAFDTAKTYFSFSSATRTNAIIHAIKQIPLVSRLLPMNVYANKGLKTFARVLAVISEPTRLLLGKFIYFAFIAFTAVAHSVLVEDGPIEILPTVHSSPSCFSRSPADS